ncbi:MAG: AAA family ATPase [Patescibacteria group bacterium]|jgi:ATP-dependent Lon protease
MDPHVLELKQKILNAHLAKELEAKLLQQIERLANALHMGGGAGFGTYEQVDSYVEWMVNLPWSKKSEDILDIKKAKQIFDKNHYGLENIKKRILEFLSVIILQKKQNLANMVSSSQGAEQFTQITKLAQYSGHLHSPILCFVGLVGTGKTTMAVSIAEALNRQLVRIPFGGLASALDLRGLSRIHPEAEPGVIMKSLRRVNVKNPVILLDELDRVSDEKRQEIMGVLVELLDPSQNQAFVDHYIDYPFDLSDAIFVATANNVAKVATAVMDRMEVIQMPSYTDDEKLHIAREYLLPHAIKEAGLPPDSLQIDEKVWPVLIRPLGFDAGIRTLKREVEGMARIVAWKMLNGEGNKFIVNDRNYRDFME